MKKKLLIIDDEWVDNSPDHKKLNSTLENPDITIIGLNPKVDDFFSKKETGEIYIDIDKFFTCVKKMIKTHQFDMIACDYTLGDDLNGVDLLHTIRHTYHYKGVIILFSGKIEAIIQEILGKDNTIDNLKKLTRTNIQEFPSRQEYPAKIKGLITTASGYDGDAEILKWLYSFPTFTADSINYERKTFAQLAEEIENNTEIGIYLKKQVIEQGISSLACITEIQ